MTILVGALVGVAFAWVLAAVMAATIRTVHWEVIPWCYKSLTGEAHARSNNRL